MEMDNGGLVLLLDFRLDKPAADALVQADILFGVSAGGWIKIYEIIRIKTVIFSNDHTGKYS